MDSIELKSLYAQINPHFLYNTLDCINGLITLNKKEDAKRTINALGGLMRMSINPDQFHTVKEVLYFINQYIAIQKIRFQDHILFLVDIPTSLYEYILPKLIIQPLIENAIIHGISELPSQGMIAVIGKETATNLIFEVKDNGVGTPQEIREKLISKNYLEDADISSASIGILNIQRRLQLIYGEHYTFTITPLFPSGSCATISIPKKTMKQDSIINKPPAV